MSDQLVPSGPQGDRNHQLERWQEQPVMGELEPLPVNPIQRPIAAIRRYKWLIVGVIALAAIGGVAYTRTVKPTFQVHAMMMLASESPLDKMGGPIRSLGLLDSDDWITLLKSHKVADGVVRKLTLFLQTEDEADRALFHGFTIDTIYLASKYELVIDRTNKRWILTAKPSAVTDSGGMLDSVGVKFGFKWQLEKKPAFDGEGKRKVDFTVTTPREAAVDMITRLGSQRRGDFLVLTLEDGNPKLAANIVNTWLKDFSDIAATLKASKLVGFSETLTTQLQTAKDSLDAADVRLSRFRVNAITLPSEGGAPIAAGLAETRDPVVRDYFSKKIEYEDIHEEIAFLERQLERVSRDSMSIEAILSNKTMMLTGMAADPLKRAIGAYAQVTDEIGKARFQYTDAHEFIQVRIELQKKLKEVDIPRAARELIRSMRATELQDSIAIANAGENLRLIPDRTIQEERLRRAVDVAKTLYMTLENQNAQSQLAKAGATPDMSILDSAIAPLEPTVVPKIRVIMMAIGGGIAVAIGLAILLDMLDGRLRYAEQVTNELGLPVAGTVPRFPKGGVNQNSPEQMYQLVESFRSLRMSVLHSGTGGAVSLAVSSAQPGDGKSLISANLAMSFADAGLRTILVDGDTRRGALHEVFGASNAPGLTDYLSGAATLDEIIRTTGDDKLVIIPCGVRRRRSPELLTSPRLGEMVELLRASYDVVIFDTPPLAAGIDGYSIATATGSLLVVMRVGATKRRLCMEKLRPFDRLPVNIVGAVMNGIAFDEGNDNYAYAPGYDAADEPPGTALAEAP